MADPAPPSLESILLLCQSAAPEPWYPKLHAEVNGIDRNSLDPPIDALRLGGWIALTEWVAGKGQGYRLTEPGQKLLQDPQALAEVRAGRLPAPAAPPPAAAPRREEGTSAWDRGEAVREAFLNPTTPVVTFALIVACVLVYVAEQAGPQAGMIGQLLQQGGVVYWFNIVQGQWWRLVTSAFFHVNLVHLLMNMYALYVLGGLSERLWGRGRYITLYFLSAFVSGLAVALFTSTAARGASGAICGIFAALAIWLYRNRDALPPPMVAAWKRNMIFNLILITLISLIPNVSWQGHLGGAVGGAAVSFLLDWQRFGVRWLRRTAIVGLVLLPVLGFGLIRVKTQLDPRWHALSSFVQVTDQIDQALQVYREQIEPTLMTPAANRDPAAVERALQAVARLQVQATQLQAIIQQPLHDRRAQQVQAYAESLLAAVLHWCESAADELKNNGDLGPALEGATRKLERNLASARRELRSD